MPCCVVCPNLSTKGVKMCYFPKDDVVRNTWMQNVNEKNWTPRKHAAVHFAPYMWEKP